MAEVKTWPWLVGGPGDGEPLPREDGQGPFLYPRDGETPGHLITYREVKVIVDPERLAVRVYVVETSGNPALAALQAMARHAASDAMAGR